jgi:glyoxylase-like metal-dependent hydrolase (beta-lactamase superfamily II)
VTPADIDVVFCTHLHVDHVGWNTRLENGQWVPTFPNARYLFPAEDEAHYGEDPGETYTESVLPVIAAGQAELVRGAHETSARRHRTLTLPRRRGTRRAIPRS